METVAQYDEYCHYVAGLVGIGLSDLFYAAKLEEPVSEAMSNSMGLFLQVALLSLAPVPYWSLYLYHTNYPCLLAPVPYLPLYLTNHPYVLAPVVYWPLYHTNHHHSL